MTQIGFANNLADAFSERAKSPEMVKQRKEWAKRLTPSQKKRMKELLALSLPILKKNTLNTLKKAPADIKRGAESAVSQLKDKDSLAFMNIDLEYGVVGSMPPVPLKTGPISKLTGSSIRFGSRDAAPQEGICIGPDDKNLLVLILGEKSPRSISPEQIIAIGEAKVETSWTKETPRHPFNDPSKNTGTPQVPNPT